MNSQLISLLVLLLGLTACTEKEKRQSLLPNVTGKAGEIVLIIGENQKTGAIGTKLDSILGQFQIGLPQDEPIFDLITIPPSAFQNVFERHRNIINLSIKPSHKKAEMLMKEDEWAHPQTYVSLQARNEVEMIQFIDSVQGNILKLFLQVDRKRTFDHYKGYRNTTVSSKLKKAFGFDLVVPKGYNIDVNDSSFMWLSHETRNHSQGIIIYTEPYLDTTQLTTKGIFQYRDTLFKYNVPGPREGSYMQTEQNIYEPETYVHNLMDGQYTVEARGLWNVENDYMGGPFISYSVHDSENNRIINLVGYVYAPKLEKRNYVRQLETIFRSFKLISKEPVKKQS